MSSGPGARPYHSRTRREHAAATRAAILDAAEVEFGRRGYVATSVALIARAAGVAPETVYARFGSKRAVLEALVGRAVAGDDEPGALLERAWVAALADEPDRNRRAALLAREGAAILARRAAIDEIVGQAAGADAEAAAMLEMGRRERWAGQRQLIELVAGPEGLPVGGALDRAADVLFAVGSPEVYRLLVAGRGWTHEAFEAWYASMVRSLVGPETRPAPGIGGP